MYNFRHDSKLRGTLSQVERKPFLPESPFSIRATCLSFILCVVRTC